ncbi:MAG: right-handed parallel beta-helix repeat-containing protein [Thermoanaerobaculales bacterium]|jgi:predicted outer membrane repeat protein|nr:right-handed parallel beta-helix repeat-containing protein [Thermoanaerobaculales bacterium]
MLTVTRFRVTPQSIGLLVLLLALSLTMPASATTLTVTRFDDPIPDGCFPADCSLREAIILANAQSGLDTVVLATGIYQLSLTGADEDAGLTGDLDSTDDLELVGAGRTLTTILSFALGDRLLHVQFADFTARDLLLSGGTVQGANGYGGGLFLAGAGTGNVSLTRVDITASSATQGGGGIYASAPASLTLNDCDVSNNTGGGLAAIETVTLEVTGCHLSDNSGGAIAILTANAGYARIQSTVISDNVGDAEAGGGLTVASSFDRLELEVVDCTFDGNIGGSWAGGLQVFSDEPGLVSGTVVRTVFSNNETSGVGGGLATRRWINNPGTVDLAVLDCDFLDNSSAGAHGGGAAVALGVARFQDTEFSGNSALLNGGAIFAGAMGVGGSGSAIVTGSRLDGNTAGNHGGAIYADGGLEVSESSFVGNTAGTSGGGVFAGGGTLVTRSTFSGNQAVAGGGLATGDSFVQVFSSTYRDNLATSSGSAIYGGATSFGNQLRVAGTVVSGTCSGTSGLAVLSDGHNLESPGASCFLFPDPSDLSSVPEGQLALGPLTTDGRTSFYVPGASSVVRDRFAGRCADLDQRVFEPVDPACDAGAVEVGAVDSVVSRDGFEVGLAGWSSVFP